MRLLPHIILAFIAIGLQRGLEALLTVGTARVDLVMIAAAFTATCFPRPLGSLAAVVIGLAYDLSGAGPIGLYAASLGLGGAAASALPVNRWPRQAGAMLVGISITAVLVWGLGLLRQWMNSDPLRAEYGFMGMAGTILLTGLLALPVSLALWKWRRAFTVEGPRF